MVEFDGQASNSVWDVFEEWNHVLKAEGLDKHPLLRGPRP